MTSSPGVLAVIPAKMTSRRLPRKNLAALGGRPLLSYTLAAAASTPGIDRIVVSSESPDILRLAERFGAASHVRPEALCDPSVRNEAVIQDVLAAEREAGREPEIVMLLQPTHPLRDPSEMGRALAAFREREEADCLMTVVQEDVLLGEIADDGLFRPEVALPRDRAREPERYRNTGSFYLFRTARTFARGQMFGETILPFVLARPEFEVDIDHAHDLALAEALLATHATSFAGLCREIDTA